MYKYQRKDLQFRLVYFAKNTKSPWSKILWISHNKDCFCFLRISDEIALVPGQARNMAIASVILNRRLMARQYYRKGYAQFFIKLEKEWEFKLISLTKWTLLAPMITIIHPLFPTICLFILFGQINIYKKKTK